MDWQDGVSSTNASKILERMRFFGSFSVPVGETSDKEILKKLDLSDLDDADALEGFHELVEEGSIRASPLQLNLGMSADLQYRAPVLEDVIMYSVD